MLIDNNFVHQILLPGMIFNDLFLLALIFPILVSFCLHFPYAALLIIVIIVIDLHKII